MDNKLLLKVSISVALIGIIGLYIFTSSAENSMNVADTGDYIGQRVTLDGVVGKPYASKDGHVFFDLSDSTGTIKAVAFRSSNIEAAYELKEGQQITLTGKVEEYKDALEIVASKIDP